MKKGLYALSFGTFGLGIAEFIMMSILPDVAAGFDISLSEAGHLISAYALGVCVGAPLVVVVARSWPLRTILLALVGLFVAGNLLMALSADYWMGLCARFVSRLPHGAYFGVGSIVASRLAEKGKKHFCCSYYDYGDDDCQFVRCPGREFPGALSVLAFGFCDCSVVGWRNDLVYPEVGSCFAALPATNLKGQFRFLRRPEPWMLIAATMLGNGGSFFAGIAMSIR